MPKLAEAAFPYRTRRRPPCEFRPRVLSTVGFRPQHLIAVRPVLLPSGDDAICDAEIAWIAARGLLDDEAKDAGQRESWHCHAWDMDPRDCNGVCDRLAWSPPTTAKTFNRSAAPSTASAGE